MDFQGLKTSKELIITKCQFKDARDAIHTMASLGKEQGFVNDLFLEKIWEREEAYPTGLPTEVGIAIPHVHDGCLESFFAMATLEKPIHFASMGGEEELIDVSIIFLFGITDPANQTKVLRKFATVFQDGDLLRKFLATEQNEELMSAVKEALGDYIIIE